MDILPPTILTDGLTKCYRQHLALSDCSLEVGRGEIFGLLGPNGAGKTTLLRLLMGFLRPTSGAARIDGFDCYQQPVEVHRRVAYLPGDARLYRHLRGGQLLRLFAQLRGQPDDRPGREVARRLDLDLRRRVYWMSTGMRQKLALTIALSAQVPVLILDEPTANLDPTVRGEVLRLVTEQRKEGATVLFSSHVLSEIEEVCDRVAILRHGRLVHTQIMRDLRRWHRIRIQLDGPVGHDPPPPGVALRREEEGWMSVEASQDLSRLLRWLASLPIREMAVQPIGLRAVYDHFHAELAGDSPDGRSARSDARPPGLRAAAIPQSDGVRSHQVG